MTKPLLAFNPYNGVKLGPETRRSLDAWRVVLPQMAPDPWLFNPWTGQKRDVRDIKSDPQGLLIMLAGEQMMAAPMAPPPAFLKAVAIDASQHKGGVAAFMKEFNELPDPGPSVLFAGPEPETFTPAGDPQYGMLYAVLMEAFAQASTGKGKERHANDLAFTDQKIFAINRILGSVDGILYQVMKKTAESKKLPAERACAELMGAIVYAAAGILFIRENSL